MKKILAFLIFIQCGTVGIETEELPLEDVSESTTTTTSTTTTIALSTTTTLAPSTTTTLAPSTTTTLAPSTTTTTVPETFTYSLNFPDSDNQFPEIPYCKLTYEEVEKQLKDYFLPQNIRLTIRKYLVETSNSACYGYVSGSNYTYLDEIKDGAFVEVTVEWSSSKREFPTTIANSPNAVGNGERWDLYCDDSGTSYLEDSWRGVNNGSASDQYFYWGLYTDLTSPYISCVPDAMLASIGYFFGDGYACKNLNCEK